MCIAVRKPGTATGRHDFVSAQCTDDRVNKVTKELFQRYPTAQALAAAPIRSLEKLIQSTGFFRNKAKNIKACCQALVRDHDGEVPQDLDTLVKLAGVGRKNSQCCAGNSIWYTYRGRGGHPCGAIEPSTRPNRKNRCGPSRT